MSFTNTPMPDKDKLKISNGLPGYQAWLTVIGIYIVQFCQAATRFQTCTRSTLTDPHEDDRYPPKSTAASAPGPKRSLLPTPTRQLSADFAADGKDGEFFDTSEQAQDKAQHTEETTAAPKLPSYICEHDKNGELTPAGRFHLNKIKSDYLNQKAAADLLDAQLFAYILSTFNPCVLAALQDQPSWYATLASKNPVDLRELLDITLVAPRTVRSLASLRDLTALKRQPNQPTSTYQSLLRALMETFRATFESGKYPGYVSFNAIHTALLLNSQPTHNQPFVDQLIMDPSIDLLSMTPEDVEGRLRNYELAHQALNRPSYSSATKSTNPPFNKQSRHSANDTNNALATTTSCWTPDHPHSHPRNTGPPGGDPTRAFCHHCLQNGWLRNKHGTSTTKPCSDLERLNNYRAQQSPAPAAPPATHPTSPPPPTQAALITQLLAANAALKAQHAPATPVARNPDILQQLLSAITTINTINTREAQVEALATMMNSDLTVDDAAMNLLGTSAGQPVNYTA